jgi:TrmH family RNA methyltransferase
MEFITSRKNPRVIHLKKLASSSDYRAQCGEFFCDGIKLLDEAVKNGATVTSVLFCDDLPDFVPSSIPVYKVTPDIIQAVSPMKTPQNIVFTCAMANDDIDIARTGRHIVLDGIQDPGNVGTIVRTANAFGFDSVILVGNCADVYNPKTIRSTMGAIFRQKLIRTDYAGLESIKSAGMRIYASALHRDSRDIRNVDYENSAIVIGSEGSGVSQQVLDMCDGTIVIPMMPECESLNAAIAASVIMWESKKDILV